MITICKNCRFIGWRMPFHPECTHPEPQPKEFIYGAKYCEDINTDGKCQFYKEKEEVPVVHSVAWWRKYLVKDGGG